MNTPAIELDASTTPPAKGMSRWRAALIHLAFSAVIIGMVTACILYFWYPPALFRMADAGTLLLLFGGVDLIAGPLLTLIVFKAGKPTLRMDLTVIALLQAAFLLFGLYAMMMSRPVYIVGTGRTFDLVLAPQLTPQHLREAAGNRWSSPGYGRPELVGARLPEDRREREKIIDSAFNGNGDLQTMPRYYVSYDSIAAEHAKWGKPLVAWDGISEAEASILQEKAVDYGRKPDELLYLPLVSVRGTAVMLIDGKTGAVVGPVDVEP